jgi:hypothetical protein
MSEPATITYRVRFKPLLWVLVAISWACDWLAHKLCLVRVK